MREARLYPVSTAAPGSALSRIDKEQRLRAAELMRTGRVFDLGTDLGGEMPEAPAAMFAPYHWLSYHSPETSTEAKGGFQYSMDLIMGSPHVSSHLDGLAHIQGDGRIFGGSAVSDVYGDTGWREHGVETVPPIVGRAVLLDVPTALGVEQLDDSEAVTREILLKVLQRQQVEIRQGDIVLVRTGKIRQYIAGDPAYYGPQPGVDEDAGVWLYEHGMSVLGTDTSGTEPMPYEDSGHTVHRALLVDRGVHLLEILNLEELAEAQAYEAFFVCSPLRVVGATGSWVRPIAMI